VGHGQARIGGEREPPWAGHLAAGEVGVVRGEEDVGERDVPARHPPGILEERVSHRSTDRLGGRRYVSMNTRRCSSPAGKSSSRRCSA
jgi:hypothetical protein